MKRKVRDFRFDIKAVDEVGNFSGYASVYDTLDAYNEKVAPGAFEESLKTWAKRGRLPPVLWQHDPRQPVGPFTKMNEDDRGLYCEGQLLVADVPKAREARALMKARAIDGLSIGFDVDKYEYDKDTEVITLTQIDLWETSIVTFPANADARVIDVKAFGDRLPSVREFEEVLREAGFSRSQAACIATHGLGRLLREAEGHKGGAVDAKSMLDELLKPQPITVQEIFR